MKKRQRKALPFCQPNTFKLLIFFIIFVILKTVFMYLYVCGKVRGELKKSTQHYIYFMLMHFSLNLRPERKNICLSQVYVSQIFNVKRGSGSCWKQ